jgi:ABC-type ATPase with predicted acetyltransferase domain
MSSKEWCLPYASLSDGQRARADAAALLAAAVRDGGKGGGERGRVLIDEFTSLLDRRTAAQLSRGMCAYIERKDVRGVVLATCHKDVVRFLAKGSECLDWAIILKGRYVVTL